MTDYLTVADLLAIHVDLVQRYGGARGVRDPGALESAVFRPQTGYYSDLVEEASALWESLSQNHPFVDGNKRLAFAATYTFLRVNGYLVTASAAETFEFITDLHTRDAFDFEELVPWLRKHTRRLTP